MDAIRLDVSTSKQAREEQVVSFHALDKSQIVGLHSPMNETEVMRGLDRKNALYDIEPCHILRGTTLDKRCH